MLNQLRTCRWAARPRASAGRTERLARQTISGRRLARAPRRYQHRRVLCVTRDVHFSRFANSHASGKLRTVSASSGSLCILRALTVVRRSFAELPARTNRARHGFCSPCAFAYQQGNALLPCSTAVRSGVRLCTPAQRCRHRRVSCRLKLPNRRRVRCVLPWLPTNMKPVSASAATSPTAGQHRKLQAIAQRSAARRSRSSARRCARPELEQRGSARGEWWLRR